MGAIKVKMSRPSPVRRVLGGLYALWMGFAHALGFVTRPLFFFVVFVVAFGPIGILWKCIGHDPLDRRLDSAPSCWKECSGRKPDLESMLKQF